MKLEEQLRVLRSGAGVVRLADRGLIEVRGGDRVRWLNGMLSNDVSTLAQGPDSSGCYALLLTHRGAITADFHVMLRPDAFWLETSRGAVAGVIERLERFIVADDVELLDRSDEFARLGVEGPGAAAQLSAAAGAPVSLTLDSCGDFELAQASTVVAAFGWSGEQAFQIFVAPDVADRVLAALLAGEDGTEAAEIDPEALEVARIEAGTPQLGAELDEEVLPDEAGLDRAISTTKGCYTGQEIVARLRSRGQVNHLLVGLRFEGALPAPDAALHNDTRRTGEVTSACASPVAGLIGLGFVRRDDAVAGTSLKLDGGSATVALLPFVSPTATAG